MTSVVKEIIIYPIKGLGGISVQRARALHAGFENDRRWMLVDKNNEFITQRTYPGLALFKTELKEENLIVVNNNEAINFNIHETTKVLIISNVWDDQALTEEVSPQVSKWFCDQMNQEVKLVKICNEKSRIHHISNRQMDVFVSLADGYPFLLIGEESMNTLNSKLSQPVSISRFRPNIVVSSTVAHEEDHFTKMSIGSAGFLNIKPCARCSVITIDQQTAEVSNDVLKVLSRYRKVKNNVFFGTNIICTEEGMISTGDELFN